MLTRGVAVVVHRHSVGTHCQQLFHRVHVAEVCGQRQRRVPRVRSRLEGCLFPGMHTRRIGQKGTRNTSTVVWVLPVEVPRRPRNLLSQGCQKITPSGHIHESRLNRVLCGERAFRNNDVR